MEVAAPAWAVAYGICGSGGDFIDQTNWQGLTVSTDKHSIAPGSPVSVYNQPLFESGISPANGLTSCTGAI